MVATPAAANCMSIHGSMILLSAAPAMLVAITMVSRVDHADRCSMAPKPFGATATMVAAAVMVVVMEDATVVA